MLRTLEEQCPAAEYLHVANWDVRPFDYIFGKSAHVAVVFAVDYYASILKVYWQALLDTMESVLILCAAIRFEHARPRLELLSPFV